MKIGDNLYAAKSVKVYGTNEVTDFYDTLEIGDYIGKVTATQVFSPEDINPDIFIKLKRDTIDYYILSIASNYATGDAPVDVVTVPKPKGGTINATLEGLKKLFDSAKNLLNGKTDTTISDTGSDKPTVDDKTKTPETPETKTTFLDWFKKNWIWFLPTVILAPLLLIKLATYLFKKKSPVTPPDNPA